MHRLPIAMTAAVMLCAAAAHAAFVNGVERFDGTILDTNTWTWAPTSSRVSQNNFLTIDDSHLFTSYTAHSFTLGAGQGVRVTGGTLNLFRSYSSFLLLSDRSAGFLVPAIPNDQSYVGLEIDWEPQVFHPGRPALGRVDIYGVGHTNSDGAGLLLDRWDNVGGVAPIVLEVDRLDRNQFRYSVFDSANQLIGTAIDNVQNVPPDLYVVLSGFGMWDDVTIVSVPEAGTAGLTLGLALTITRRNRTRPAVFGI